MNLIFSTLHGSRAYGLHRPTSDTDIRGFFLPEREHLLGFLEGPQTVEIATEEDTVYWDVRKFFSMASKANPNALEVLFTDPSDHLKVTSLGAKVIAARHQFLSKRIVQTFGGYARGQLHRISGKDPKDPGIQKDASHCVRLVTFAERMLTDPSRFTVKMDKNDPKTNLVVAIRAGIVPVSEAVAYTVAALHVLDRLGAESSLPDEADGKALNALLCDIIQSSNVFAPTKGM
jgi:uncharacterized protein